MAARTLRIAFDTNCFIDANNPQSQAFRPLQEVLHWRDSGRVHIMVSRHTLHQLERKADDALKLAKTSEILPYYPIGTIDEQVATIAQLAGTWDDARRNEAIQEDLQRLAKSGTDIRDRGAYIDALSAKVDIFVTSDRQLAGSGPASRISAKYGLRILTPLQFVEELHGNP